nr:SusD/RagB family nutrient-binding outer membrane lipoprotein [uncultured Flavobacterium sp.]
MKKYIKNIILATFSISLLVGCQTELDTFNDNPNDPSTSNPSLLIAAMELGTFQTHSSGLMRNAGIFTQHLQGTNVGQLGAIGKYIVNEGAVNNEWNLIYGTTLMNGHILNRDFAENFPYYNGIGQVLTAINLGYATDMWGDVPYDEAFLAAEGNQTPKYNTQQEIYERLQTILDKAIVNLSKPVASNEELPGKDDFIFNGSATQWIKVARVLKARYALRLTSVDANAAQKALDYVTAAGMTSNNDDANTYFIGEQNSLNQWYSFENDRSTYLRMGKYFVDYLVTNNDPRLPFMVDIDENLGYSGNAPEDDETVETSYIGGFLSSYNEDPNGQRGFASHDWQIGIVTYAEAKFIEAEAKARLGQTGVQAALQQAVTASVTKITGVAPSGTFLANATTTFDIANIIQQKYIALFLTMEPYNDYRRTGFPALIPNQNSDTKTIAVRLPTPSDERQYNRNATVVSNVTTKLWWDAN